MQLHFAKMNGAGNDFVVIDNRDGSSSLDRSTIARLCDRHRGIGGDGLLAVESPTNGADFRMRYYNADGGEAEMCGNGARCFARYAARLANRLDEVSFETIAGVITAQLIEQRVCLAMSESKDLSVNRGMEAAGEKLEVHFVNTGVPHAIIFRDDLETLDVRKLGSAIRWHEHFAPKGTNANFVKLRADRALDIRTYERGVEDETLACGTGVVAAALISNRLLKLPSPIGVHVRGGEVLEVGFDGSSDQFRKVTLTGPADFVFEGAIQI